VWNPWAPIAGPVLADDFELVEAPEPGQALGLAAGLSLL
jgi:hypothetical protein